MPRFYNNTDTVFQSSRFDEIRRAFGVAIEEDMTPTECKLVLDKIDAVALLVKVLFVLPEYMARDMATDYVLLDVMLNRFAAPSGQEG